MKNYQICTRCVMDTTDPLIEFDENGVCNHCKQAEKLLAREPYSLPFEEKEKRFKKLAEEIKEKGKGKQYDCIIGISGGVDSTYVAYLVKKYGLRPLAVHLDNGWNSELAVMNIENALNKLGIDLYTHVIDWEEFKDLQLSFLKASTPDSEIPSDHAIFALMYMMAEKYKVEYVLTGMNQSSESILPKEWSQGHNDWKYIKSVHKQFGSKKLKTFPHYSLIKYFNWLYIKKIKWISTLDYFDYDKEKAKKFIIKELSWRDYGGKHHESNYTKIYQAYILPTKFGYDKRKAHLSSLIVAGQITREEALEELQKPLYDEKILKNDIEYLINKFQISQKDFDDIMKAHKKSFDDYPSYYNSWYYPKTGTLFFRILRKIYKKFIKRG